MEEIKLEKDKWYLVKEIYFHKGSIFEVYINYISELAINVAWKRNDGTIDYEWKEIKEFNKYYKPIEILPKSTQPIKFDVDKNFDNFPKTKYITCPICHGMGTIPDDKHTAGNITCPLCQGNKMIPESIVT